MYKEDDRLEDRLNEMEKGHRLPDADLEGDQESGELSSLVYLAASIRGLPHPEQRAATARAEKRQLMAAAQDRKRKKQRVGWSPNGGFTGQWMVIPAVAGAALLILMAFVLAAGAGIYYSGPIGAQAAVLSSTSGLVEVLDEEGTAGWTAISDGDKVKSGERLRTGADSRVVLTFFDGTQVTLDPNTDLMLNEIDGDWGKKLRVSLIQNGGMTSHQVVPLKGNDSAYSILTPSGEASVRGTSFNVMVEDTGDSVFAVETGAVLVSNNGDEAVLAAGQGLVTELGKPLEATSFLFLLNGELQDNSGKTWTVEGVSFTVKGGTRIDTNLEVGDSVLVSGRISNKNEWIADSIVAYEADAPGGSFTGVVTGVSPGQVEIDGNLFTLPEGQPEVNSGDLVRVQFTIIDGAWVVVKLEVLDSREPSEPEPEPEPEIEEPDEPETALFFASEEDKVTICGQVEPFMNTLVYEADESAEDLHLSLVVTVEQGLEYIVDPVSFTPDTSFTIQPGGEQLITVDVALKEGLDALPPQAEVEIKVEVKNEDTGELTGAAYKVKWECDEELPEEEQEDSDGDGDRCTRDTQHPHALTLAQEYAAYGATYDKIWDWFCHDNLGFGEIELGYKLHIEYGEALGVGYSPDEIIEMRLGGLGWGQIKQELKQAAKDLLVGEESQEKVPPGKEKSEEAKNKDKPNKKDD
ncbi:MAG: FecR domain-containing protein [Anaerolineales bacterium]